MCSFFFNTWNLLVTAGSPPDLLVTAGSPPDLLVTPGAPPEVLLATWLLPDFLVIPGFPPDRCRKSQPAHGLRVWTWPGSPHRRWQDRMRDKSIQRDCSSSTW